MSKLFSFALVVSFSLLPTLGFSQIMPQWPDTPKEFETIELGGDCAIVDGKYPTDGRCYEVSEFSVTPENVEQEDRAFMALHSVAPPTRTQTSQRGGSKLPGMKEAKEIMNTLDWFWRFLEKNRAGLTVNTKGTANAIPTDPACQAWDAMAGWSEEPKAIPFTMVAKNPFGIEVLRLEYAVHFTYGGSCNGRGKYLENVRLIYRHAAASLFFTAEVDVEVGDIVNFAKPGEEPIAGLQIMTHNRLKSLVKSISQSNAYYVRGDGQFKEVMPHLVLDPAPNAMVKSKPHPLVGDGYQLLNVEK